MVDLCTLKTTKPGVHVPLLLTPLRPCWPLGHVFMEVLPCSGKTKRQVLLFACFRASHSGISDAGVTSIPAQCGSVAGEGLAGLAILSCQVLEPKSWVHDAGITCSCFGQKIKAQLASSMWTQVRPQIGAKSTLGSQAV